MLFTLRVSIPDRPGMLGEMATAFGKGNANILSLDVIDREEGLAVDDICVEAPDGMEQALKSAAEAVPGLVVEEVRPAGAFRDILAPMELAAVLSETDADKTVFRLIEHLPDALWATWAAALKGTSEMPEIIASSVGCPSLTELHAPWLLVADCQPQTAGARPMDAATVANGNGSHSQEPKYLGNCRRPAFWPKFGGNRRAAVRASV